MSLKISAYEFKSMVGDIGGYADVAEDESRPGVDGHTMRKLGKRGHRFQLNTLSTHKDEETANKASEDYAKLPAEFVSIERNALSIPKVFIVNVMSSVQQLGVSTDGNTYAVRSVWTLMRAGE
ncbi:MAG: hypothetical protein WC900_05205 [Oscillospiraceae bacterium]|jgi:hypothetical protein